MSRAASSSGNRPTPVPNATSARERQPSSSAFASVERVARSMISEDVGPPSSIVAAWITQRAGMSPAVVSTASPSSIGARSRDSSCTAGPPALEIAAATPPPWSSWVLAALAMASTSSSRHVRLKDLDLHFLRSVSREGCTRLGSPGIFG